MYKKFFLGVFMFILVFKSFSCFLMFYKGVFMFLVMF